MKWTKVVKKYYEFIITKFKVIKNQKHFKYKNTDLKYMYKTVDGSDALVIIFSACTRPGLAARYNYVKTLDGMKCNRLYILDDFGPDGRGSYYLGRMPEFEEQEATIALIDKIIRETSPKKTVFCGSCKGGYGALNIGSRYKDAYIIIGEPTYRIATEFGKAKALLEYWMGEVTDEKIRLIDDYLNNQLKNNDKKDSQRVFVFYSLQDEYYSLHSLPLTKNLQEYGYKTIFETSDFTAHADLGLYYPAFLTKHLQNILTQ